MVSKLMIALGGNAIRAEKEKTSEPGQFNRIAESLDAILTPELFSRFNIVLSHGNGPQIGNIIRREEISAHELPITPIDACVAQTQGSLGYMIQNSAQTILKRHGIRKDVATIISQVLVDPQDPEFSHPTKPIGSFYNADEAQKLQTTMNWTMMEDAGRGYRRVIASPKPLRIIEHSSIEKLVESGFLVIAVGGGGIPVFEEGDRLIGLDAVIDKDLASALLANSLHCKTYAILTAVDFVQIGFRSKHPIDLKKVSLGEIKMHFERGQFPPGSMGPKIAAAIQFLQRGGEEVIITSPKHFSQALFHGFGTHIIH